MPPESLSVTGEGTRPATPGRLADHLRRRFGKDQVFLDIDTIDPGKEPR
jgi:hypothetical protein